jgi:hypothetical protein
LTKPSLLIVTGGIVASLLFACMRQPPRSTEPGGGLPGKARTLAVCPVETFLGKAKYLARASPPYTLPGSGYSRPPIDPAPVSDSILRDLGRAFSEAHPFFKGQLCNVAGIYIDRTDCDSNDPRTCRLSDVDIASYSWGFRSNPSGDKYIGISLGLWKNGGQLPPYDQFRTRHIRALLKTLSPKAEHDPRPPRHIPVPEFAPTAATLLAVLAHEYGHALWFDTFVVKDDGTPDPGGPINTDLFCFGTYYSDSWRDKVDLPLTRWIGFGDVRNRHRTSGIDVDDLRSYLGQENFILVGNFLQKVYSGGEWSNLLAAFSPDEDFVETFELYVLLWSYSGLSSPIEITGTTTQTYDIPRTWMSAQSLTRKMSCIGGLPQTAAPAPAAR